MRLKILASSSSGNCALVESGNQRVLIDAGISFRKIDAALAAEGLTPGGIDAVFVTHEHLDHTAGLSGFIDLKTPVYSTRGTIASLPALKALNWKCIPSDGRFEAGPMAVESFSIPHDAAEPIGYVFPGESERLVWALDMGHLDSRLKKILQSATTLVLESNYCPQMLEASRRPWSLKQRIRGRHGHLSNEEAYEFLTGEGGLFWRQIFLAHLSAECNSVEKLEALYAATGLPVTIIDPKGSQAAFASVSVVSSSRSAAIPYRQGVMVFRS